MITYWFPTGIYHNFYPYHENLKIEILSKLPNNSTRKVSDVDGWPFWTQNTQQGLINPLDSNTEIINSFASWVESEVTNFAKSYGSLDSYKIDQCWVNQYQKGDFQETHIHLGFDFSAIYFVAAPEKSGKVIFENPNLIADMRPIRGKETELSTSSAVYKPVEGQLLIFRSNLRHGVYPHRDDLPRISIAFNLLQE